MAKKAKNKTRKHKLKATDWSEGQPLAFPKKNPTDVNLPARSVEQRDAKSKKKRR